MTKEDLVKEFDRLIEAHYSEEIDSRDEWLREIINLKHRVVKKLIIPVVVSSPSKCYTCDNCGRVRNDAGCIVCGSE